MSGNSVWVFVGSESRFPSGVFSSYELADSWIRQKGLSGLLTEYPLNISVYDWAINSELFTPSKQHEFETPFIQKFTSASQRHYHYESGCVD